MLRIVGSFLLILLLAYLGLGVLLYLKQRSFIYFPQANNLATPENSLILPVNAAHLHLITSIGQRPQAIIYFGGNAEDVSLSLPAFEIAYPAHDLYLVNYRSYGNSSGKPTETALFADALAVFDHVQQQGYKKIIVIGRSLGSGVACYLASQRSVDELSLVTPFDSLLAIAQQHYPVYPLSWLLKDKYESWRYAPKINAPTTLLIAAQDEIIPNSHSKALFAHFPKGQARYLILDNTQHNTISQHPDYYASLIRLANTIKQP